MDDIARWNARYRDGGPWEPAPSRLLVEAARDLAPGRALDLACGAGRHALHLASLGWQVVALDGAEEAIRIVGERARALGLSPRIDARVHDLERDLDRDPLPFGDESFDLVADLFYLHRPLFDVMRRLVRPGGLVVAAIRVRGIRASFCLDPGELAARFADWEILHSDETDTAELVARRPRS